MNRFVEEWFKPREWLVGHQRKVEIGPRAIIMGILNVTPDSFSDGGEFITAEKALERAQIMVAQGADVIDVGGESTRPGAEPVDQETEISRILPVIEILAKETNAIISIDTYRSEIAKVAIDAGAHIINDVWAGRKDSKICEVAAQSCSGYIAMHTSREREVHKDPIEDQALYFKQWDKEFSTAGISGVQLIFDPGIGFGKTGPAINLELLNRLDELHCLGKTSNAVGLMVGTSRKRFLGTITGKDAPERGVATAATSVVARMKGAAIFRVHDIEENRDALAIADALIAQQFGGSRDV